MNATQAGQYKPKHGLQFLRHAELWEFTRSRCGDDPKPTPKPTDDAKPASAPTGNRRPKPAKDADDATDQTATT